MGKKNSNNNTQKATPTTPAVTPPAPATSSPPPTVAKVSPAGPQPVATRNNVARANAAMSNPTSPVTTAKNGTGSAFPPATTAGTTAPHPQQRPIGNRPGEFKMPNCNNNRQSFNNNKTRKSSSSPFSMFVTIASQLMKIVVVPVAASGTACYAYQVVQKDSALNGKVVKTLQLAEPLPAVADDLMLKALIAVLGLFLVKFTVTLFSTLSSARLSAVANNGSPLLKKSTNNSGFDSDENNNSNGTTDANNARLAAPYAMPRIKKEKDSSIVALRSTEYARLDRDNQCYLDYTGGMLYPESLIRRHTDLLLNGTFGNPHSSNPTSFASTALCEKARADVLKFFNADPEEYLCIFTSNASGALRIVGESFPFVDQSQYLLLMDNHNSVNGIREFATTRGAKVTYARTNTSLRIDDDVLEKLLEKTIGDDTAPKLFAYPAQSNFSGVKHSLEWVDRAQQLGWHVLLDAAAFVPTSPLDLSAVHPDFVSMSFYKIFGYPTGVGALLLRKRCVTIMQRPWFAGGTIKFVTCVAEPEKAEDTNHHNNGNGSKNAKKMGSNDAANGDFVGYGEVITADASYSGSSTTSFTRDPMHVLAHDHEAFEDGTINYLSLAAISYGLEFMTALDMKKVSGHVQALTSDLIDFLSGLVHSNGQPMISILGPNSSYKRGGTVSINVVDVNNQIIPPMVVEKLANEQMISIRSGCFCNPGDSEILFPEAWRAMMEILDEGDPLKAREMGLGIAAAIRISVGIPTSDNDIRRVIKFLSSFKNSTKSQYDHLMVCPQAAH